MSSIPILPFQQVDNQDSWNLLTSLPNPPYSTPPPSPQQALDTPHPHLDNAVRLLVYNHSLQISTARVTLGGTELDTRPSKHPA